MLTARLRWIAAVARVMGMAPETLARNFLRIELDHIPLWAFVAVAASSFCTTLLCRSVHAFFVVTESFSSVWLVQPAEWTLHCVALAFLSTALVVVCVSASEPVAV